MLEAFALDVPTLLFWDKNHFGFSKEAQPFFDNLEEAKILHYSPESAANFLNENWNDYSEWWEGYKVRSSLREFCKNFVLNQESWEEDWHSFLENLDKNLG